MALGRPSHQVVAFRGRFASAPVLRHAESAWPPTLFHRVVAAIASHGPGDLPETCSSGPAGEACDVCSDSLPRRLCLPRSREALRTFPPARSAVATAGPLGIVLAVYSRSDSGRRVGSSSHLPLGLSRGDMWKFGPPTTLRSSDLLANTGDSWHFATFSIRL